MPTPLPMCSGPHPALPLGPSCMLPPLKCPLGFLLALLPFPGSMGSPLPLCWADATTSRLSSWTLVWGVGGLCPEEAFPNLSLSQPQPPASCPAHSAHTTTSPQQFRSPSRQHLENWLPGLSAAQGGDLHVSTNIYAHPGPPASAFLGWPFTPGPEAGQR